MTGSLSTAVVFLQAALVLAIVEGVRRRNVPAVVNGLVALGAALLPALVQALLRTGPGLDVTFGPELPLWIAAAGLIHAVGMLGLYDTVWWWDHLAHTVSAALVTALTYAAVLVAARGAPEGPLSPLGVVGITVGFLLLLAVAWELIEELARHLAERHDVGPLLVVYGPYDWAYDLVFNLVGAGLILLLDLRVFVSVFEPFPRETMQVLLGVGGTVGVGSALLALYLGVARDDWP
jgi:hypothetical protein